jgi:tetratricopeptide (TPR) repeat protein
VAHAQGECARARALFEESLALRQKLGNKPGIANTLHSLGNVIQDQGDYPAARAHYEESLALWQEQGDQEGIATALHSLGQVAHIQGDEATAHQLYRESLMIFGKLGIKGEIASLLEAFASLAVVEGQPERAARLYGATEALRETLDALPPRPRYEQDEYDRQVAAIRAVLGDETHEAAWSAGRALSWEETIAYALK